MKKNKHWYDYLWIWTIIYLFLGFFNILFAWLGMIDFLVPLIFAIFWGNKTFCNRYCGRGKLYTVVSKKLNWSNKRPAPKWLSSKYFRYGFLTFFMIMFGNIVYQTWLVFSGASSLRTVVKLFWTFKVPWKWAYTVTSVPEWVTQYSYGFYSLMLTSTLIGLILMVIYRPRTWCSFCPMGAMTQSICKLKNKEK